MDVDKVGPIGPDHVGDGLGGASVPWGLQKAACRSGRTLGIVRQVLVDIETMGCEEVRLRCNHLVFAALLAIPIVNLEDAHPHRR